MPFQPLARLIELEDGFRRVCRVGGRDLLLICSDGRTHLVDRACPHAGSPLDRAVVRDGRLVCPRHGIAFDLASGRAVDGACPGLAVYPLLYEGTCIGIEA